MVFLSLRKVLIIPMGQPETINQRIDDTMIYKTLHRKLRL